MIAIVRPYKEHDIPDLIDMMRDLASFEEYIDDFKVTEDFLYSELSKIQTSDFGIIVAELGGELSGYATYYPIHFTYSLKPTLVLKELYVKKSKRSKKIGQRLFGEFIEIARQVDATKLVWSVMPSNEHAKQFYRRMGGVHDTQWERWSLNL